MSRITRRTTLGLAALATPALGRAQSLKQQAQRLLQMKPSWRRPCPPLLCLILAIWLPSHPMPDPNLLPVDFCLGLPLQQPMPRWVIFSMGLMSQFKLARPR